ncbi:hypothetical protein [Desulfosoma sp.]|uniref:hypothetical protein n=1 Tax=Desulfosoma sp. TaxID=2603217 RepID=UPI004049124C
MLETAAFDNRLSIVNHVVFLDCWRRRKLAHAAFRLWRRYFSQHPLWNEKTRWKDLSHSVLLRFASEHTDAQRALFDLIMVCQELGHADDGQSLDLETLCRLFNGYFYLMNQAQCEIMARLAWVQRSLRMEKPLVDLACDPFIYETKALLEIPAPCPKHPGYEEYRRSQGMERAVVVRKAIGQALRHLRAMA